MSRWEVPAPAHTDAYLWIGLAALALAAILLLIVWIPRRHTDGTLSRRRRKHADIRTWKRAVTRVTIDYASKRISDAEAYARLSAIARDFASVRLGVDLSTQTLLDLNQRHQIGSKKQFQQLRQTIAALYPPEFANAATNAEADQVTVMDAANWVETLSLIHI